MANPEHFKILREGVEAWNLWRHGSDDIPDLTGADLHGIDLSFADLRRARLRNADFRNVYSKGARFSSADLTHADLRRAKLTHANLSHANLTDADLTFADLRDANLSTADLTGANVNEVDLRGANLRKAILRKAYFCRSGLGLANLTGAELSGANFAGAYFGGTILGDLDLTVVEGIERIYHEGPSTVGIDTIYKSNGKISEMFLRGCGVPDIFIDYAESLAGMPFEFYSAFISYSTADDEFVWRLHNDLQANGVRCWFAPKHLKIGEKYRVKFDNIIRIYDKVLLVLSRHSVLSDWVEKEVETALEKEREQKRSTLFPIRIDDAVNEIKVGWPADIRRTRHIGDFRGWKDHGDYQKSFEGLLSDLQARTKS